MDFNKILPYFKEFYFKIDKDKRLVLDCIPNYSTITFPCDFNDFKDNISSIINKYQLYELSFDKIFDFIINCSNSDSICLKAGDSCLELIYNKIEKEEYVRVTFISDTLKSIKDIIPINSIDSLTKLNNRDALKYYVNDLLKGYPENKATIFLIDVDYFKNINDYYGHLFGDNVIVAIADALMRLSSPRKFISRLGGDEFVVVINEDLNREEIKSIAREIRYNFDNLVIDGTKFSVTSTMGIVSIPKDGNSLKGLYECLDKALYRGKQKGRDCHIIYDEKVHSKVDRTIRPVFESVTKLSAAAFINKIFTDIKMNENININNLAKEIADFFLLDRIVIFNKNEVNCLYERNEYKDSYLAYKDLDLDEYAKYFLTDSSLIINDYQTWITINKDIYDVYMKSKMISAVQCVTRTGDLRFISFESIDNRRIWQAAEISYLAIISGIVKTIK